MAEIQRLQSLIAKLRDRAAKSRKDDNVSVSVGYTAEYAIYLHEMLEPKTLGQGIPRPSGIGELWGPPQYGPKFLEGPMRELQPELGQIIHQAKGAGKTTAQALLLAGLRLQRESQARVPVEYGNLKASAFTRLDDVATTAEQPR